LLILGIDPGTQFLGFGVLEKSKDGVRYVAHGTLKAGKQSDFSGRLFAMAEKVEALFEEWKPEICVVEKIFLGKNVDSAFKLGHIRGVCMHQALKRKAQVHEYTPRVVKQGITGSGSASKEQVQMLLYSQLSLKHTTGGHEFDASDALALAFYHSMRIDVMRRFQGTGIDI
jgi:crossover junction endodeoxyribonuclease RuvC